MFVFEGIVCADLLLIFFLISLAAQQLEMIPFEEDEVVDAVMAETSDTHMSDINLDFSPDDPYYGLIEPQDMILIRTYSDDSDDTILDEISPRFIVMYEPNSDFVRRIEVSDFLLAYVIDILGCTYFIYL